MQRKCAACGQHTIVGGECAECRTKRLGLQRQAVTQAEPATAPPIVHEVLRSAGQPLNPATRDFMESRFGHDFSQVRVHTDAKATSSATAVGAHAYTVGHHIAFQIGRYAPSTATGRQLLAHELAHVLQQGTNHHPHATIAVDKVDSSNEVQARRMASSVMSRDGRAQSHSGSGPPLTGRGAPILQRWTISGNVATADRSGYTLGKLAKDVGASFNDWKCIKPISMRTFGSGSASGARNDNYERYVQIGDQFDISNLTAAHGATLRLHLFDPASEARDAAIAQSFYPGSVASGGDVDIDIEGVANSGQTPIREFLIFGHAAGPAMFGGSVPLPGFQPTGLSSEDPPQSFNLAAAGLFPRRCWFTRNATARSVGCNSTAFGNDFAATYLRKGANIVTTTEAVRPKCQGLPFQIGSVLGIPGGCAWYNGLDFATGSGIGATTLEGPFWSVSDFHAGSHWDTVAGNL